MCYIKVSDLQKLNGLYIHNITEGMSQYLYYIMEGTEEQHYLFLSRLMEIGASDKAFVDFYYKRINASNIKIITKYLTEDECVLLDSLIKKGYEAFGEEEFLLVELRDEILKLLLHISYQECLFSSFYFTWPICTIWSNYGGRFLLFAKEQEQCDPLIVMAKEIGMLIER